ncbi:HET-domain-containing protein [Plenodomus tracheiphilus IPT5]|uniref:HET-domain-containing protein n=1 Tax=Plenodomus tracheiphilus IPT5 TaxID=1408161 RepID=A0A6A7AU38_9PLEO|nr:HET-domain-containing protein [Plenodomus tracheiphilus IPT5]
MQGCHFCDACQRFLRGEVVDINFQNERSLKFVHHRNLQSLTDALSSSCMICSLAWGDDVLPFLPDNPDGKVTASFRTGEQEWEAGTRSLNFEIEPSNMVHRYAAVVLSPWEIMVDHQYPDLLPDNTRTELGLSVIRHLYQDCVENHIECATQLTPKASRPSRILDIGGPQSNHVRLLLETRANREGSPYACLSHCWGGEIPFTLTKHTLKTLVNGVSVDALPRTFRDAIFIARKFYIQYLWIDSMCIMQGDEADWSFEAARMSDVYAQAVCTIAATHSKDSKTGLFFERQPSLLQPLRIQAAPKTKTNIVDKESSIYPFEGSYWCDNAKIWTDGIEKANLSSRAWACQERQLSRRIVHCGRTQLFWECHRLKAGENYPKYLPKWTTPHWFEDTARLKRSLNNLLVHKANSKAELDVHEQRDDLELKLIEALYFSWSAFRITYSVCSMSKEQDKLVAIQGIAERVGQALGDSLVAGLWSNRFLEELCWSKNRLLHDIPVREPTKWRAPSWSWVCSNARIWNSTTSKLHRHHPDWDFEIDLEDIDVKTRVSGELEHGLLQIKCRLLPAIVEPGLLEISKCSLHGTVTLKQNAVRFSAGTRLEDDMRVDMDVLEQRETKHVHMVIIQHCIHSDSDEVDPGYYELSSMEGLFLVPHAANPEHYVRVGLFRTGNHDASQVLMQEHKAAELRTITLA